MLLEKNGKSKKKILSLQLNECEIKESDRSENYIMKMVDCKEILCAFYIHWCV